jgi:hypothetical protein
MRLLPLLVLVAACGGDRHQIAIGPPPPKMTQGVLAGPLCNGEDCKCRDLQAANDGGAGLPGDARHKRYEIRMTSPQQMWATIGGNHLYKTAERPEACFYVDLPSGETAVELRASDRDGAAGAWAIRELGTKTKSYYDTFVFNCGSPGVCSFDELDSAKREYATMKKGLHDPCGSTKLKGLAWDTGKAPDNQHPSELLVRLKLDVFKFAPWKPHGDPSCGKGRPPADAATGAGNDAPAGDDAPPAP